MVALLCTASLSAQSAGTITGHVSDPSGAAIPGATVTLTNPATNTARTTVSTSAGDYTFPYVLPGVYNLQATHNGFKADSNQNLELQVGQSLRQDFTLQVGEVSQTVTVEATGALLQSDTPTLGTVVPAETISQMPLNNRNYLGLVAVSANTNTLSPTQGQAGSREGGARASESISVGGQRIMYDHYTLDGVNNTDVDFNTFVVQPTIDAIQEMKVQTGVYPAQYGYNATQVNVVTKSGGNQYHGAAFDFVRNSYADALGYDYTSSPLLPVPFKYNDYGFVLDGPIRIPHLFNGKDKFFFMVNDEWYSSIKTSSSTTTLPSAAMLTGDFSAYPYPIYDPTTGNPDGTGRTQYDCGGILNNMSCKIDPESANLVKLFYTSGTPSASGSFSNDYQYPTNVRDTHDGFNVRGDYYESSRLQFAFRFSNGLERNPTKGFATTGGTVGSAIITDYYQYMGSSTWTISPTIVNVATFGDTNFYNSLGTYSQGSNNAVGASGIPNLGAGVPATWGIPNVSFTDRTPWLGLGDSTDGPYVENDPTISVNDTITIIHGKHSIDMGVEYDRQTFSELGNQFSRGNFVFQPDQTAQVSSPGKLVANTGSGIASLLAGQLYSVTYAVQIAQANYVRNDESAFVDDNFKLTPKFSLQAGLRYELTPPWTDTLGNEFNIDFGANNSPISPDVSGPEPQSLWPFFVRQGNCNNPYQGINVQWVNSAGAPVNPQPECANGNYPNSLVETRYYDWAPRLGFSYIPTSSVVVRAGYGIFFNHDVANARFDMARNLAGRVTTITGGGQAGENTIGWSNAVAGGGTALIPPPYSYANTYSNHTSNSQVFLLNIQKQIGQNWVFETGYMGTISHNLAGFRNANYSVPYGLLGAAGYYAPGTNSSNQSGTTCTQSNVANCGAPKSIIDRTPYPNFGVMQLVHDQGVGRYNAFSFQVNKKFSSGFNLITSYTYGKSLDDTSGIRTQQSALFAQNDLCITCEYGPSDFDVRHRVVGSVIYELPVGKGRMWAPSNKAVDAAIGGWELTVLGTVQTGTPFTVNLSSNSASTNTIAGGTFPTRPNVLSKSFYASTKTIGNHGQWLNPAAFQIPANGFLGNASRNMLYGPGVRNFDISIDKNFDMPYNEHHQLQIRLDAFNAFNHTDFANPAKNVDQSTFGEITGTNSSTNSRELQLAAKYTF